MRPLDPDWWRYARDIAREGPNELGYAFFRARRRRRNLADEDEYLSESDTLALSGSFDITQERLRDNADVLARQDAAARLDIRTVQWFLPWFFHPYFGGVHTILRYADHLARTHGVENRFCVYDCPAEQVEPLPAKVAAAFPALTGSEFSVAGADLPDCDAAIATYWTSAYPLLRFNGARAKFYWVADFEPLFYAAGSASALVEQTYRLGFPGLVNTPGLADVYRSYGNPSVSFVPAVDRARYHPPATPRPERPVRIFFYGRPTTSRNAFGLGIAALAAVKERYGDGVEIISAGDNWNPAQFGVADRITNLGILPDPGAVADLYRTCDIGLAFMLTCHPSYQPLEFMASGVVTVSNDNPHTAWLLRDGENALTVPPAPTLVADAVGRLVEDPVLRRRLADTALAEIEGNRWEDQFERVWRAMTKAEPLLTLEPETGYRGEPPAPLVPAPAAAAS